MSRDKPAKKKRGRKDCTGSNTTPPKAPIAYIVDGQGTDAEIAARFAKDVPGWEDWSELQQAEAVRLLRAFWKHPNAGSLTVTRDEGGAISVAPKSNPTMNVLRLTDSFASTSADLIDERISDLTNYHGKSNSGGVNERNLNASLAFIAGGGAQDTVQAALLTQMAATHDAALRALANAGKAQFLDQMNTFANIGTKLLNVYARQAETLAKLQRGAEQTVRHLYVDARTQTAINCPPGQTQMTDQSYGQHEGGAFGPAMLGNDPAGNGVPMPSDIGPDPVQDPRGKGGRSDG